MITRSKFLTGAAILQFVMGIFELISALPILAAGRAGMPPPSGTEQLGMGGPPFWAGVLFLILAVVSLFGAYGLWINQKWGKVVAVITRVVFGLFALGDVLNSVFAAYYGLALASVVYVLASILVIVLVLRRESRTVTA
jgi:hypothetical protein